MAMKRAIKSFFGAVRAVMVTEAGVASFLLHHRLFLTALELYQELREDASRTEASIPRVLRAFAQLPEQEGNIAEFLLAGALIDPNEYHLTGHVDVLHSEHVTEGEDLDQAETQQRTLESSPEDQAHLETLETELRDKEESIQMLSYSLRQANETIESLKSQLTVATSAMDVKEAAPEAQKAAIDLEVAEEMKSHEKRTLNFLTKKYLVRAGYKLSAISLSDEATGQDVDSWKDVGLDCSEPPSLLSLYRYFYNAGPNQFLNKLEVIT
jgi:hypothetical protein